jgi:hypothetical protein
MMGSFIVLSSDRFQQLLIMVSIKCAYDDPYNRRLSSPRQVFSSSILLQKIDLTFVYIPGVEHWQFIEPPAPLTTRHCHPHGEDLLCSASIPSGGINAAHMSVRPTIYFPPHLQIAEDTLCNSTLGSLLALRSVNENNFW